MRGLGEAHEGWVGHYTLAEVVLEEVDVLVDDINPSSPGGHQMPSPEKASQRVSVARDVGAHVLPRGEGGHV